MIDTTKRLGSYRLDEKVFGKVIDKKSLMDREDVLERLPLEMMKLMEMYQFEEGQHVRHWSKKPISGMYDARANYTPQEFAAVAICRTTFDEAIRIYGANGVSVLKDRYGTPDNFINVIRDRMLTESNGANADGPKYTKWFMVHKPEVTNAEFARFMKTLALCFSGQLTMQTAMEDYWEPQTMNTVRLANVKYKFNIFKGLSEADFFKTVQCIILHVISGYAQIDFTDLL